MDEEAYKKAVNEFYDLYRIMQKEYGLVSRIQLCTGKESILQIYRYEGDEKRLLIKVTDIDDANLWRRGKLSLERAERMILLNGRVHTDHFDGLDGMERGYPEETGRDSW